MSPLRPTNTSSARSSSSRSAISPIGVMFCALATLVTVPVLMSSGASSDGEEVAVVAVTDTVSAIELEADVDVDALFDAGADLEAVPEVAPDERDVSTAANAVAAAPQSLVGAADAAPLVEATAATSSEPVTSTTISDAPAAPTTTPPTTAAPTTQAPTTAAPTTQAPTTEAAVAEETTTTAPPSVESAENAVVEEPQSAAPSTPSPEQWAALRLCESSGNYSVVSSNGLYHGAYQFYQPTWDGLANQLGRSDLVGLAPSQAAPADQDALALLLWQQRGNQPWPHCGRHLPSGS